MNDLIRSRSHRQHRNETILKAPPLKYKECQIFLSPITLYSLDSSNKLKSNIEINKMIIDDIYNEKLEKEGINNEINDKQDLLNIDKRRSSILDKLEESYKKHVH